MNKMQAIEFESLVDDGVIRIPDEYKGQVGKQVKVIVLSEVVNEKVAHKPLSAISINTKGFRFDRDEANAR